MGIFDRFRNVPVVNEITLRALTEDFDIIEVNNDIAGKEYIIAAQKQLEEKKGGVRVFNELGSSSPSPFTSWSRKEYNTDLFGLKGLETYDRMRKSDGTVRGLLRLVKTPVLAARWFIEPASDSEEDQKIAAFVERCLWEEMHMPWTQFLTESLLMCEFGYYMFEKVWELREIDGIVRLILAKLAPRHPMDVEQWHFDEHGGPNGVEFFSSNMNNNQNSIYIPIEKMLVFTFDQEAGNIEGISLLRPIYKHWYYKEQLYKIDAIQKERHGIGIPVIKLPMGFNASDVEIANNLGRNLRSNERAHIVLPPNWELMFAKLEGHVVDSLLSAKHHNEMMRESVLAAFTGAETGATGGEEQHILFLKATRFIANIVADSINRYLIPELVGYNFAGIADLPELKYRRIGESADLRTMSFAIRNFIGAGVIIPDEKLDEYVRDMADLPKADPSTVRMQATPQGGPGQPNVGPPRQSKPSPGGTGKSNTGTDGNGKSGGA